MKNYATKHDKNRVLIIIAPVAVFLRLELFQILFSLKTTANKKTKKYLFRLLDYICLVSYTAPIATNNTGSKKMTLTEALAKLDQMYKDQPKQPKQDYHPQPKQTKEQARAQYNFMRGMP